MQYIVTYISDMLTGFGWVNRFIGYSQVVTTIHYNALKITVTIYSSTALVGHGHVSSFLIYTHSVGLLGWGITPSQGR
jgi:hypothetical protein